MILPRAERTWAEPLPSAAKQGFLSHKSYRDDGNRCLFDNANTGWDAVPKEPFAPVLTGGPLVDRVWRQLLERGGIRPAVRLTQNPDLHLEVDGQRVDPASTHGEAVVFALTRSPREVRVVSRAASPDALGVARDPRVLGVALRQIVLRQGARFQTIQARDACLAKGFHAFEVEKGWRWTDGNAVMPGSMLERLIGPTELVLHVGCTSTYPIGAEANAVTYSDHPATVDRGAFAGDRPVAIHDCNSRLDLR